MKSKLKNFSLLTISTLIMAVGIYFFKFTNNFTFGGITGIAVLVAKFLPIDMLPSYRTMKYKSPIWGDFHV